MAKYRPIDVRLWNDQKFLSLDDDGRMLWLFLLTTPSTLPIPGVVVGGPAALAEQMGWSAERFRQGFAQLLAKGLSVRADFDARVVWLTNGIRRWPPQNPNMVRGWSETWEDVPECPMKHEIWQALKVSCADWSELFAKGFPEPFRNGSRMGMANQEQEQEQEERESGEPDVPLLVLIPSEPKRDPVSSATELVIAELNRLTSSRFETASKVTRKNVASILAAKHSVDEMLDVIRFMVAKWRGDERMREHLVPSTLLRPNNFERYLENARAKAKRAAPAKPAAANEERWFPPREDEAS
jgi:uncharacterized phage protein (TIGR02220 family)